MRKPVPSAYGIVLASVRTKFRWSKARLAAATGKSVAQLTRYEKGDQELFRPMLRELLAPFPLEGPEEAIDALVFAHDLIFPDRPGEPALTAAERRTMNRAVLAAGTAAAAAVRADWSRRKKAEKTEAARRAAESAWTRLQAAPPEARRRLVADRPEYRTVALAARVCEASVRAAAAKAGKARELAELALFIAERVAEPLSSRAQGYCWAFIGNSRRVAENFDGADEAFARAWALWKAGVEHELLPEWRLFSLEASLRRAQHRFSESLGLLKFAREKVGGDKAAEIRLLLQMGNVLEQSGDIEAALGAIAEAVPFVEAAGDSDLLFALRFSMADDLSRLERYTEVAKLLPQVRELALERHNELELNRVLWLQTKLDAGQGRLGEAATGLERVRQDFLDEDQPYEAALASLDLAVVWLRAGRTAEVQELAAEMEAVFRAKKIRREALAALLIFCEAAKRDTATVALVQRTIADIEKARRSAPWAA